MMSTLTGTSIENFMQRLEKQASSCASRCVTRLGLSDMEFGAARLRDNQIPSSEYGLPPLLRGENAPRGVID